MKKITVSILTTLLMLSMVFSSSVFAAEKEQSAWDSFLGLFSAKTAATSDVGVEYRGHIQNVGNYPLDGSWIQGPTELGTEGKGLRLEGFWIQLDGDVPADAHIEYQVHVQNVGWMDPVQDGEFAGTEGRSLQIEAIKISLVDDEGVQLEDYSVVYSGHVQNVGDVGPFTNGEQLGTVGSFLRLEAIEVEIVQNPADLTEYNAALAAVTQADYTAASWTTYQAVVNANKMTEDNLQSEVDAATANITAAQANLVLIPKVTSVTALNATQVQITFNKAADKASLFTDGISGAFKATVTFTTLDGVASGALTGTLSADGKTLTVTAANALSKRYDVVVDALKATDGTSFVKYAQMSTFAADKTAPTIVSTTKISATTFKVTFSEPMNSLGTVSYKLANGTATADVTNDFGGGPKTEVVFTLGNTIVVGDTVTATLIGASDKAGNLLSPNPATTTFTKSGKDGVIPTVSSITQTGAKAYTVKFSEELSVAPATINITGNATVSITKDTVDATKYNVVVTNALDGATTINIATFTDLSGEVGPAQTKVAIFTKDAVAPKLVSSAVTTDTTDGKQYLELTFDKDLALTAAEIDALTTGSYVKDYVTTSITGLTDATLAFTSSSNLKVVRAPLATLLTGKDVQNAVYTLALDINGVTSTAGVAVVDPTNVTFTRGLDGTGTGTVLAAPTVAQGADNNKVNVTFTGAVDGASATNVGNYLIGGAVVESVTLQPLAAGTQIAILNLAANSNTFTGVRNVSVSNVKALGSDVTMEPYSTTLSLKENVVPTITKAELATTDTITLTFSEPIMAVGAGAITEADFEVYVDGVARTIKAGSILATATGATTVTVTMDAAFNATDLGKVITIKPSAVADIHDASATGAGPTDLGNKLSTSTITVTKLV